MRARPPLEPTGATWQMRKKPRELRIEETWIWGFCFKKKKDLMAILLNEHPQGSNCSRSGKASIVPG